MFLADLRLIPNKSALDFVLSNILIQCVKIATIFVSYFLIVLFLISLLFFQIFAVYFDIYFNFVLFDVKTRVYPVGT